MPVEESVNIIRSDKPARPKGWWYLNRAINLFDDKISSGMAETEAKVPEIDEVEASAQVDGAQRFL